MFSKPFAVGVLALACVSAAAGGAYFAGRHTASPTASAAVPVPAASTSPAATPVQETEAVIAPSQPSPAPALEVERPTPSAARPQPRPAAPERPAATVPSASRSAAQRTPARAPAPPPEPVAAAPAAAARPESAPVVPRTEPAPAEAVASEPARVDPPAPPSRIFDELVIPQSSVVGLQIETPVSSERARLEDRVEARVLRDIVVDGRTALPAGARAIGAVTLVERGGKMKERARLGVRFHTLVLADGTELPMRSDTIYRDGDSPVGDSARKIGGAAAGGAILGAILGGKKGAILGGATGAAGGSAVVMAGDRNAATLPVGAVVTVRLAAPIPVEVERR